MYRSTLLVKSRQSNGCEFAVVLDGRKVLTPDDEMESRKVMHEVRVDPAFYEQFVIELCGSGWFMSEGARMNFDHHCGKADNKVFIRDCMQLKNACKVMLLDAHHRAYLETNDPQALKQLIEAVMNVEPGIIDEMKRAEMDSDQEMARSARRIARLVQVIRQAEDD